MLQTGHFKTMPSHVSGKDLASWGGVPASKSEKRDSFEMLVLGALERKWPELKNR